jgi:2-amino-4-hydroxy-6-hydroxymethyldihydropteridine diphosphokinase
MAFSVMTDEILISVAFGSNLGDRSHHLSAAAAALGHVFRPVAASAVYGTAPQYVLDQPPFLNAVALYGCRVPPLEVLDILQDLEWQHGRVRSLRHGPRTLDLDLLAYGDVVLETPRLVLPHPGIAERAFVLRPWADVAPGWRHPGTGQTVAGMLAQLGPVTDVIRDVAATDSLGAAVQECPVETV